ncbi:MAG: YwaF family protein [Oscillospiraceae bacterium]|nr:YwaF family protein [Oscillospiraceae bacterium]
MQLWEKEQIQTLLPAIGVMAVLAIILRLTLGKREEKIRLIPLQIIAVILLALEVGKQTLSIIKGYDLYHIPLHYCSLFIYVLPVMAFYKGKHRQKVNAIGAGICAALTLLMLIYPGIIYSGANVREYFTNYFSFHTVTFHNLAMFAFPVILALELHTPQKGDLKAVAVFALGFTVVAGTMAQVLKTNFANFYSCNVAPLETVRLNMQEVIGVVPTQIIYVAIVAVLHIGFTVLSYVLYSLVRNRIKQKTTV